MIQQFMRRIITRLYLLIVILFFSFTKRTSDEQSFNKLKRARVKALAENIIGKEHQYRFVDRKDCNHTRIKYLGVLTTKTNEKFKVLNSFFVAGQSCRGVSRIVIYDMRNKYLGNYYVGMPYHLPDTLIDNNLIFLKNNADCKAQKGTEISFEHGIPEAIFIPCDQFDSGDYYTYSTEE